MTHELNEKALKAAFSAADQFSIYKQNKRIPAAIKAYLAARPAPVVDEEHEQMKEEPEKWPLLKKALWDVVVRADLNTQYTDAWKLTDQLYEAALAGESGLGPDTDIAALLAKADAKFAAMSPEEQAAHREKQRQSYARSVEPCGHGVADWETCPDCREAVIKSTVSTSKPTVDMEPVTRWVPRMLTGEAVMQTTDTHEGWYSYVKFTDHQAQVDALQAKVDQLENELNELKEGDEPQ